MQSASMHRRSKSYVGMKVFFVPKHGNNVCYILYYILLLLYIIMYYILYIIYYIILSK